MKNKFFLIILLPFFLLITTVVNSKITYVEKQVTGIGENYKMALRDAIREAISQVNGVTQETDSLIKTCLLYTSPSPRDGLLSRMPSSA